MLITFSFIEHSQSSPQADICEFESLLIMYEFFSLSLAFLYSNSTFQVYEKLEKPKSPGDELETKVHQGDIDYEITCNDVLLPLGMSLAAVRQYVWKQSTELIMYYRRR